MIEARGLSRRIGSRVVVDRLDLAVPAGVVHGLLGPNGAGKTTALRMVSGVTPPQDGTVAIDGHDLARSPWPARASLGFAPDPPPLYDALTVRQQLVFVARVRALPRVAQSVERAATRLGLAEVIDRPCARLSHGWRRRVGIACAIVHDPPVVVLDEPTSGLDPAARVHLRSVVRELADAGRAVLLSTHEIAEARAMCDRVTILRGGRVADTLDLADPVPAIRLTLRRRDAALLDALRALPGVDGAQPEGDDAVRVVLAHDVRDAIAAAAVPWGLVGMAPVDDLEARVLDAVTGAGAPR